jgi:hypothetical protein
MAKMAIGHTSLTWNQGGSPGQLLPSSNQPQPHCAVPDKGGSFILWCRRHVRRRCVPANSAGFQLLNLDNSISCQRQFCHVRPTHFILWLTYPTLRPTCGNFYWGMRPRGAHFLLQPWSIVTNFVMTSSKQRLFWWQIFAVLLFVFWKSWKYCTLLI